ncbi:MAG: hypothetical protein ISR42_07045 [Acidimicrobiia bacterium]|nr:hypothetical protein [Actinomycetota bacterium]MBL6925125.1 hypothetical protein [Acidimicrobiia bacterium]
MRLERDSAEGVSQAGLSDDEERFGDFDEDGSPTRLCRNAREFSFDGFAEDGEDLQIAWRERLAREGKLNGSAESVRDLILGQTTTKRH